MSSVFYTYGNSSWGDQLTAYDGTTISYDASGNPLNWRNVESLSWTGRELTYLSNDSGMSGMYFRYNADGIRTYKSHYDHNTMDMYHVNYVLDGTKVVSEYYTHEITNATYTINYYYDANNSVIGFNYNGTDYYYRKNLQGDIIAILNTNGTKVVEYTYNAWGEVLNVTGSQASTIGQINPFRYRGYYYDTETGFYYLQTRYYDPTVGRFLNADGYIGANGYIPGYNMFAYCSNAPINNIDPYGEGLLNLIKKVLKIAYQVVVKVYKAQKEAKDLSNTVEDIYTIISSLNNKEAAEFIMVMDVVILYKYPEYKPDSSYLTNVSQELYYQCCLCAKEMLKSSNDKRVISILNSKRLSKDDAHYLWINANIQLAMRVSQFYSIVLPFAKAAISMFVRYGYSIY